MKRQVIIAESACLTAPPSAVPRSSPLAPPPRELSFLVRVWVPRALSRRLIDAFGHRAQPKYSNRRAAPGLQLGWQQGVEPAGVAGDEAAVCSPIRPRSWPGATPPLKEVTP